MKRKIFITLIVIVALLSIICDFLFPLGHENGEFWWSHFLGFFLLFGFIGCLILIIVAKLISHYWLERKEDYYD